MVVFDQVDAARLIKAQARAVATELRKAKES